MKHNISNLVAGLYQYYFVERKPQLITLARISDSITCIGDNFLLLDIRPT